MLIHRRDTEKWKEIMQKSQKYLYSAWEIFRREREKCAERFVYHSNFVGTTANDGRWKVEVNSLEYFMRASTSEMALLT